MLEALDVQKDFATVRALNGVSLSVSPGEIRAILGGNGSGKSTLAKVITGVVEPDKATIKVDGRQVHINSPIDARRLGISATYQELSLLNHLSVYENLLLDQLPNRWGIWVDNSAAEKRASKMLERLGIATLAPLKVRELALADRYLVELAKALAFNPKYLILDELTSALRREQVQLVRSVIEEASTNGTGILYVSHRLEEVFEFCDSVTILRNGEVVKEGLVSELNSSDLINAMSGAKGKRTTVPGIGNGDYSVETAPKHSVVQSDESTEEPLLALRGITIPGFDGEVSLEGYPGEIIGIAGLQGHGQSELLRLLFGAISGASVNIWLEGKETTISTVREAVKKGFGFISGDRENEMIFGPRPVNENLQAVARIFRRNFRSEGLLERLGLSQDRLRVAMHTLSGGTQQKVVVGRWLGIEPRVLLADDPTRGVDVETRGEIHALLREAAGRGSLVLFSSSDERELASLCSRVYVLYRGQVVSELEGEQLTEHEIEATSMDPTKRSSNESKHQRF